MVDAKTTQFVNVAVPTVLGAVSRTSSSLSPSSSTATSQSSLCAPASTGLSTSAKAAIGVAVPVIVLAVVGLGMVLLSYRKQRAAKMERGVERKLGTETEGEI